MGTYQKGYRLGIISPLLLGLVAALLLGAVPLQVKCEFAFAIVAVATTLLGGAILITRPMRSLALSLVSALATLLVGSLAILQIVAMSDNSDGVEMGKTAVSYCVIGMILVRSAISVWMALLEGPWGKLREGLEQRSDHKLADGAKPVFSGGKYSIKIPRRRGGEEGGIGSDTRDDDEDMTTTTPMNTTTRDPSTAPPNNHLDNISFASSSSASSVRTKSSMSTSSRLRPCDVPVSGNSMYSSSGMMLRVDTSLGIEEEEVRATPISPDTSGYGLAVSTLDHLPGVHHPVVFGNPDLLSGGSTPTNSQSGHRTPHVFSLSGLDGLQRTPLNFNLDQGGTYIAPRRRLSTTSFESPSSSANHLTSHSLTGLLPPNEPSVPMRPLGIPNNTDNNNNTW